MKPRNREINIFNMSLLDILCGALGAFCFLMLALFPYYAKGSGATAQSAENVAKLQQELDQARAELQKALEQMSKMSAGQPVDVKALMEQLEAAKRREQEAAQRLRKAEQQLSQSRSSAEKTEERFKQISTYGSRLLVVTAFWDAPDADVDLWVKGMYGKRVTWDGPKKEAPGGGKATYQFTDITKGPGFEVFQEGAAAGRYEVYYHMKRKGGQTTTPVTVLAQISKLRVSETGTSALDSWWWRSDVKEEGKLIPAFVVSFDGKGELKAQALGAQK